MKYGSREPQQKPSRFTPHLRELPAALDTLPTFIYVKDRDLRIVSANLAFCRALGIPREELIGQRTEPLLGEDGALSARIDHEVIESGTPRLGIVEKYTGADGLHWVLTDKSPIKDDAGNIVGLVGTTVDITARKQAEDALAESESRLRFLTDNMADMLWVMDLSLRTTYISPSVERLLGFTAEEWMTKRIEEMATAESVGRIYSELERQLALEASGAADPNRTLTLEVEFLHKDGSTLLIEQVIRALRDDAGVLVGMIGVSRDISARKRAEEALAQSEAQLRFLADHMADMLWTMDLNFHTTYVSPSVKSVLGFTPEERKRQSLAEMVTPDSARRTMEELAKQLQLERSGTADPNRSLTVEVEYYHKDGSATWFENVMTAVRDSEGCLVGLLGVSRDISERKQAEEALRASEERYRELFDESIAAVLLVSREGRVLAANPAWFRMFGYTPEDLTTLHAEQLYVDPAERAAFVEIMEREGRLENNETRFKAKDGRTLYCLRSVSARRGPDGNVIAYHTTFHDISALKQTQDALRESERKYRELFEQSVDAINLVSVDGKVIDANPAWFRLFGYSVDDLASYSARDAYVDPGGRATFLKTIAGQDHLEDEVQFKRKDGSAFDCHRTVTVRRAADGSAIGFQTVFHDITEQKRAQRALEESESKYRALFELSKDAATLVSRDGTFLEANQAMLDLFGCTREELAGMSAKDIYEDPAVRDGEFLPRLDREGEIVDWEVRLKKRDGTVMDCLCNIVARRDISGAIIACQSLIRDITAQKRARQALKESEEKYRQLFDMSIAPISLLAPDGRMIQANDAWFQLFGYSREDMDSFRAWDIYPSREARDESARRLVENGMLLDDEARVKTKDGTFIDVLRSMVVQYNPDGSTLGYQTVWRDITAQKLAEQALKDSEDRYRRLFNQSVAPISLAAPDGHIIEANDAWFRLFGYTRDELPRLTTYLLYDDPADRDRTIERTLELGQLVDDEARHKKKDGSAIEVLRSVSTLRDGAGNVTGYQAVYRDVTELKKAQDEVLRSREQLRELAARMQQVLERERTTVAHDLHDRVTQGLTALKFDLDALKRRLGPTAPDLVGKLAESIDMVEGLTATSRDIMTELRPGMLDDLGLSAAIDWQLGQFSQRTGIRCDASLLQDDSGISPVQATALFRVLQELLTNVARHSHATEVNVGLEISDDSIALTVRDNGRGIADEQMTNADSLGLLGIHERVRALGGDFAISRVPGQEGTVACVHLPLSAPGSRGR